MRAFLLLPAITLVAAAACTSGGVSGGSTPQVHLRPSLRGALSGVEVQAARVADAYEAVQRLRPGFLRSRSPERPGLGSSIQVYIDNHMAGGLDMLRTVPAAAVAEIEYLSAPDATIRWGGRFREGVIHVRTAH
jgi:hypothetical protein